MTTYQSKITPPASTQRILRWGDLPGGSAPAVFELTSSTGVMQRVTLKGGNRKILEGLMRGPMYCASPVRVSDRVMVLKRDYGVNIRTEFYQGDGTTECERFGVYFLDDIARRLSSDPNRRAA